MTHKKEQYAESTGTALKSMLGWEAFPVAWTS
jgi:hypothetical protein